MTIGIAATGLNAGASVLAAVHGVELLGRGAIGGFAVFTVIDSQGRVHRATTQRGGVLALNIAPAAREAKWAAIISSGPDRPEPLSQFLAAMPQIGLVTGHRLPNRPGADGVALNEAVLARLAAGDDPQHAVDAVLQANPESDVGLIALAMNDRMGWGDSARTQRRNDRGSARRADNQTQVVVLHNSIFGACNLAECAAELAWSTLTETSGHTRILTLSSATRLVRAATDRVHISSEGAVLLIESANPNLVRWQGVQTVVYLNSEVWEDGRITGYVASELFAHADGMNVTPLLDRNTFVMHRGPL